MRTTFVYLYAFLSLIVSLHSRANGPFLELPTEIPKYDSENGAFLGPVENDPFQLAKGLANANGDLYLSVGTERGFIGAALTKSVTHLVLVDLDASVNWFNWINIGLLQLSKNREDYLTLRLKADYRSWVAKLNSPENTKVNPVSKKLLLEKRNWEIWSRKARESRRFADFNKDPAQSGKFKNANYLYDDALFRKLKTMADEGNIFSLVMDLGSSSDISQLIGEFKSKGISLGVLDLSNAWEPEYLGTKKSLRLLKTLEPISTSKSQVALTEVSKNSWIYKTLDLRQAIKVFPRISAYFQTACGAEGSECSAVINGTSPVSK